MADWIAAQATKNINRYEEMYSLDFDGIEFNWQIRSKTISTPKAILNHYDFKDWIVNRHRSFMKSDKYVARIASQPHINPKTKNTYSVDFSLLNCKDDGPSIGTVQLELRKEDDLLRITHEAIKDRRILSSCEAPDARIATKAINALQSTNQDEIDAVNKSISTLSMAQLQSRLGVKADGKFDSGTADAVASLQAAFYPKSSNYRSGVPDKNLFQRLGLVFIPKQTESNIEVPDSIWKYVITAIRQRRSDVQEYRSTQDFDGITLAIYTAFDCVRNVDAYDSTELSSIKRIASSRLYPLATKDRQGRPQYVWTIDMYDANGIKLRTSEFERKATEFAKLMNSLSIVRTTEGRDVLAQGVPIALRDSTDALTVPIRIREALIQKLRHAQAAYPEQYKDIEEASLKFDKVAFFTHGMPFGISFSATNRKIGTYFKLATGETSFVGCGTSYSDGITVNSYDAGLYDEGLEINDANNRAHRPGTAVSFSEIFSTVLTELADILIYACNTAHDSTKHSTEEYFMQKGKELPAILKIEGPIGRNSFASILGKSLKRSGVSHVSVYGHLTARHVTQNPESVITGFDACVFGSRYIRNYEKRVLQAFRIAPSRDPSIPENCWINGGIHIFRVLYSHMFEEKYRDQLISLHHSDVSKYLQNLGIKDKKMTKNIAGETISLGALEESYEKKAWQHFSLCVNAKDKRLTCKSIDVGLHMFAHPRWTRDKYVKPEFEGWFDELKQREAVDAATDNSRLERILKDVRNGPRS